jgi:hypothetical protein
MDTHIYGSFHGRFTEKNHPVNTTWANAKNGLAWLLDMTWDEFNSFNRAALPEYLHLLAEDLNKLDLNASILIDGGVSNPALLAEVISPHQIISLARPERTSVEVWTETEERKSMKGYIYQLPNPEKAWHNFLEFDRLIAKTMLRESQEANIVTLARREKDSVDEFAERVAQALELGK